MKIKPPGSSFDPDWSSLRSRLWPGSVEPGDRQEMAADLARGHFVRLAYAPTGAAVGLVEASKRVDYVNGTSTSPVVFLEGLYVEPVARHNGVARALVAEVEQWAREQGCSELASDAALWNAAAQAVHRALGFEETERVVYFRRTIRARDPQA